MVAKLQSLGNILQAARIKNPHPPPPPVLDGAGELKCTNSEASKSEEKGQNVSEVAECATFISGAPPDVNWSAGRREEEEGEEERR